MKSVKEACQLQPKALNISVADQVEKLDEIINNTNADDYFNKTFITHGMLELLTQGIARLAGKSNNAIFHLKQAMGGGKTHLMIAFGLLAKNPRLRQQKIADISHQQDFTTAKIVAFNGRNQPDHYLWGEIASQLGKAQQFKQYWEGGAKAPDETAWLKLFTGDEPILIMLDELPPYFNYYATQKLGNGTIADVTTTAFANMLTAVQKKANICVVVSDLEAAYDTGGSLIKKALNNASSELGRAEVAITPVNLESNEVYDILKTRLFKALPTTAEIRTIATEYAESLQLAVRSKTVTRTATAIADEIEKTYPFHPRFKSIIALFKENPKFKQTRGMIELVSRLLKSVWNSNEEVYLIGAQHFDLAINEVRDKLTEVSEMRDVIAKDLWNTNQEASAQLIDGESQNHNCQQLATLLLTASSSTAVEAVKGLTEAEIIECLISPNHKASDYKNALLELDKKSWYLHQTQEGKFYFSRQENLNKRLQQDAEKAPENKIDELVIDEIEYLYQATTKEAYAKILALPEFADIDAELKRNRLLIVTNPNNDASLDALKRYFANELINKNNLLILAGEPSKFANIDSKARHVYAAKKADAELPKSHPQRGKLTEKLAEYQRDFQITILEFYNQLYYPWQRQGQSCLQQVKLDFSRSNLKEYNGEQQIIKTLSTDPANKLQLDIDADLDTLLDKAEERIFGNQDELKQSDFKDKYQQNPYITWLPTTNGIEQLINHAIRNGNWEDLNNGYISKSPKPKTTEVQVTAGYANDQGEVTLEITAANAGNNPTIYYAEDSTVSTSSSILTEDKLTTKALAVEFLAVDTTGEHPTGRPYKWQNELQVRNKLDATNRKLELFVIPRGELHYTLDGSAPRNGSLYRESIQLPDIEVSVQVFASCGNLEKHDAFKFAAVNSTKIIIDPSKPATITTPKRIGDANKVLAGLNIAEESGIEFKGVYLNIGSGANVITTNFGDIDINASQIKTILTALRHIVATDAAIAMNFRQVKAPTGAALEAFAKQTGIELKSEEIKQSD